MELYYSWGQLQLLKTAAYRVAERWIAGEWGYNPQTPIITEPTPGALIQEIALRLDPGMAKLPSDERIRGGQSKSFVTLYGPKVPPFSSLEVLGGTLFTIAAHELVHVCQSRQHPEAYKFLREEHAKWIGERNRDEITPDEWLNEYYGINCHGIFAEVEAHAYQIAAELLLYDNGADIDQMFWQQSTFRRITRRCGDNDRSKDVYNRIFDVALATARQWREEQQLLVAANRGW